MRLCAHYLPHGAWLEEGALLRGAGRSAGVPGAPAHGRADPSGPLDTARELSRARPDAELTVVAEGQLGGATTRACVLNALDRFAAR
ncbi:hypothetical protein [Streptomyces pini]|uniref:Proline iminopeptidase n=1 Tax=Streptomyces pini TaxID=1520580 RepID=A0A1I3U9W3_9ACTN|nr:proline iminopeptidase [Streptomyces pini]